jgi:hypothetical protein
MTVPRYRAFQSCEPAPIKDFDSPQLAVHDIMTRNDLQGAVTRVMVRSPTGSGDVNNARRGPEFEASVGSRLSAIPFFATCRATPAGSSLCMFPARWRLSQIPAGPACRAHGPRHGACGLRENLTTRNAPIVNSARLRVADGTRRRDGCVTSFYDSAMFGLAPVAELFMRSSISTPSGAV